MNYEDHPIIKLKEIVEQEDWFKLADGKFVPSASKQEFQQRGWKPNVGTLKCKYLDEECRFEARMFNGKIRVDIGSPRYTCCRATKVKDPEKAADKMRMLMGEAITKIEKLKEEERIAKEEKQKFLAKRKVAENAFGLPLKFEHPYSQDYATYHLSKKFRLGFQIDVDKETSDFGQCGEVRIHGHFSLDQVKKLVDFLAECPQAVADRILQGKR